MGPPFGLVGPGEQHDVVLGGEHPPVVQAGDVGPRLLDGALPVGGVGKAVDLLGHSIRGRVGAFGLVERVEAQQHPGCPGFVLGVEPIPLGEGNAADQGDLAAVQRVAGRREVPSLGRRAEASDLGVLVLPPRAGPLGGLPRFALDGERAQLAVGGAAGHELGEARGDGVGVDSVTHPAAEFVHPQVPDVASTGSADVVALPRRFVASQQVGLGVIQLGRDARQLAAQQELDPGVLQAFPAVVLRRRRCRRDRHQQGPTGLGEAHAGAQRAAAEQSIAGHGGARLECSASPPPSLALRSPLGQLDFFGLPLFSDLPALFDLPESELLELFELLPSPPEPVLESDATGLSSAAFSPAL